jgi:hypothetical protein
MPVPPIWRNRCLPRGTASVDTGRHSGVTHPTKSRSCAHASQTPQGGVHLKLILEVSLPCKPSACADSSTLAGEEVGGIAEHGDMPGRHRGIGSATVR